jgi:hypothetical protein
LLWLQRCIIIINTLPPPKHTQRLLDTPFSHLSCVPRALCRTAWRTAG